MQVNVPQFNDFEKCSSGSGIPESKFLLVFTQITPIPQLNSPGLKGPYFPATHETILILDLEEEEKHRPLWKIPQH